MNTGSTTNIRFQLALVVIVYCEIFLNVGIVISVVNVVCSTMDFCHIINFFYKLLVFTNAGYSLD